MNTTKSVSCLALLCSCRISGINAWLPTVQLGFRRGSSLFERRDYYDYYDDGGGGGINNGHVEPATKHKYMEEDPYWEEPLEDINGNDDAYVEDTLYWDSCTTDAGVAHVLYPPTSVERPTIVLHFVGGTFFGSAPATWYRRLLEEIVKNTQAVVVATSIPVTLWQSPLQHVRLARQVESQFQVVWREHLLDEFGEIMAQVPVCGIGHSLGSRLLTVLATLGGDGDTMKDRQRPFWTPPAYSSYILISFTNYGAGAGIPGIYQLNKASRTLERQAKEAKQRKKPRRRDNSYEMDYDNDDEEEEDWNEIFLDIQERVRQQANRVQRALTPGTSDLEFYPSPEQLWKALTFDNRYRIPETLLVQFDDDEIDQSAKLANVIKKSGTVRFARLSGTHLTPIGIGDSSKEKKAWYDISSTAGKAFAMIILGERRKQSNAQASRELRQTITSYITEVASRTKQTTE